VPFCRGAAKGYDGPLPSGEPREVCLSRRLSAGRDAGGQEKHMLLSVARQCAKDDGIFSGGGLPSCPFPDRGYAAALQQHADVLRNRLRRAGKEDSPRAVAWSPACHLLEIASPSGLPEF